MAGLDDYQYYTRLRDQDNPFWERTNPEEFGAGSMQGSNAPNPASSRRPTDLPQRLHSASNSKTTQPAAHGGEVPGERYAELSINLVGLLADNLLSHPFIVLRRVCQVDVSSRRNHLLPVTVLYAAIKSQQGISVLWKGLGSVLVVKGLTMAVEDSLSKFTPLPKEVFAGSSVRTVSHHLALKCCALAIVTPFITASLVETVQSSIASEGPGIFDVFKEALTRLLSFTQPQTGRLLPIWLVVVPTVTHGLLQYILGNAAATLAQQAITAREQRRQNEAKSHGAVKKQVSKHGGEGGGTYADTSMRLQAAFIGHLCADVILYPLETVVHRLQLQGTRTIIDSLDAGYEVKPILTRYEGFWDCLTTTIQEEGALGLMKGFGAVCLQYAAYGLLLKFAHVIVREVTSALSGPTAAPRNQTVATPLAPSPPYTLPNQSDTNTPRHVPPPGYNPSSVPQHSSPARQRQPHPDTVPTPTSPTPIPPLL
uniref:Solute carrier family 25 member 46-like n=1 Tax=Hirondellea gigas TaxID=1518452 RepID=A0A2P2I4F8_9CRUS